MTIAKKHNVAASSNAVNWTVGASSAVRRSKLGCNTRKLIAFRHNDTGSASRVVCEHKRRRA